MGNRRLDKFWRWLIVVGTLVLVFAFVPQSAAPVEHRALLAIFIATIVGSIVQPLTGAAMVYAL